MPPPDLTHLSIWRTRIGSSAALALVIVLAIGIGSLRAIGMLGPANLRWVLPVSFIMMAVAPWVLMNRNGRRQVGLSRPGSLRSILPAVVVGALAAMVCFLIGFVAFGRGPDNWFISITGNYRNTVDTTGFTIARLHLFFTIPALVFSPIGEEIFFRGLLQRSLEERLTTGWSTFLECAAFGIIHLCHHGLLRTAAGIIVMPISGALWMILMFLTALLFAWIRRRTGSLYPAMASHAAFNLAMNTIIFSVLW